MLKINGRLYAKNADEFLKTLFMNEGTAYGYYRDRQNEYVLLDYHKQPFLAIRKADNFICKASKKNGKLWFSYLDLDTEKQYKNAEIEII